MPVVKGGVWTNIEDEVLKAAVSKYGLNQWARVSSLLARKTPKQCKARWQQWLDPSIRKVEWSKDEDEKLLHLAKLMPTQWNTIAPIVGRTAQQCLERYQKLLDEAEARENDDMGLTGPDGAEGLAPSADDVRRLRPGELDPDPETKPARPDTIDMDEDEKEMLSEARARLANTQGKKAKRKARERQLEESRRLAALQKRRELKTAGINIKITTRKPGQMDYNADIPFEKAPAPGFYDTTEEMSQNERERALFDPRKQQLANKRKNEDKNEGENDEKKRRKNDSQSQATQAAIKAGQMQKIREAERSTKRRALNLPEPQVSEQEMEDIVKMGMSGERASQAAGDSDSTRGLVSDYSSMVSETPIRTPMAPKEEDRVANEVRNARARTETQSALLGGDNPDVHEGEGTTGYQGVAPSKQANATPNPMTTPMRNGQVNGTGPGATPMRTPRDTFRLNDQTPRVGQTPREVKMQQAAARNTLAGKLAALPKPKDTDFELELPEEQDENAVMTEDQVVEDSYTRDQRDEELRQAAERAEFLRQTQVVQKQLPQPSVANLPTMLERGATIEDPALKALSEEASKLVVNDQSLSKNLRSSGNQASNTLAHFEDSELERARAEIALEISSVQRAEEGAFDQSWVTLHPQSRVPGLAGYASDDEDAPTTEASSYARAFEISQQDLSMIASSSNAIEKKLALYLGGYQARSRTLRGKMVEAAVALEQARCDLEVQRVASIAEQAATSGRLEKIREEVQVVSRRESAAQEAYRLRKVELDEVQEQIDGKRITNGIR